MPIDEDLKAILQEVLDPETGYSIIEMGIVYRAERKGDRVEVDFTLTYPGCPIGDEIAADISQVLRMYSGANDFAVNLVWDPPWNQDMMSEGLRLEFGYPVW